MMGSRHKRQQRPRLDRRNARKDIDYDADATPSSSSSSSRSFSGDQSVYKTRSLDLSPLSDRTSFRIEGIEGQVDHIFQQLGLGLDDFSIPVAAWEARKILSPSSNFWGSGDRNCASEVSDSFRSGIRADNGEDNARDVMSSDCCRDSNGNVQNKVVASSGYGINGTRPPKLVPPQLLTVMENASDSGELVDSIGAGLSEDDDTAKDRNVLILDSETVEEDKVITEVVSAVGPQKLAPPPVKMRSIVDDTSSTWDIFKGFGPQEGQDSKSPRDVISHSHLIDKVEENVDVERRYNSGEQEEREDSVKRDKGVGLEIPTDSLNDENGYYVSPNGSLRCGIKSWQKGDFLGSGSFGTVYEGFTDDGFFFAVKEVSLLDQGNQGQQSIYQLEQEISLLSQFQHENIVRYLGTDKDDAKLYIFLELVTKGSLARLYGKYQLRDTQVSAYTRQILSGLNYLHCRNVVHRDIKCANILVDVRGSVKLADFGLAKSTKLNDIKSCKGTPFWMAPEVVNQKSHGYGLAADIWSLGCTVLEMLTGQIPYSNLEGMQALFRIGRGQLPPIPNTLSRDAEDFILKCLQVNPDERPSAAQLLDHPFVKKPPPTSPISMQSPHRHATW
ncbi:mitogen-activated protein kinase kinase kinase 1-like [Andrographis paniculata]|uniref:mitogen-activated protein kinase kinase kinase 1-like n=1 Tax=Andrographis paniculata TaxID=175694 RepID=UPI0021E8EA58|nr:mitogen-activated protein kinase kinase kinase 1-like [Andrographis paniculata]